MRFFVLGDPSGYVCFKIEEELRKFCGVVTGILACLKGGISKHSIYKIMHSIH
jgi:hypothetical protein